MHVQTCTMFIVFPSLTPHVYFWQQQISIGSFLCCPNIAPPVIEYILIHILYIGFLKYIYLYIYKLYIDFYFSNHLKYS